MGPTESARVLRITPQPFRPHLSEQGKLTTVSAHQMGETFTTHPVSLQA